MKILIVEDDFLARKLMNINLSSLGMVDIAINGIEAILAVKMAFHDSQPYDLICLDIMMPKLDGVAALKKIREIEAQNGLNEQTRSKVIMTTALSDKDKVIAAVQAGCDAYIIKPVTKSRLYDEMQNCGLHTPE